MPSNVLSWVANPVTDNIIDYEVWGALGTSVAFGGCSLLATVSALTWTHTGLGYSEAHTYYIVARNAVGASSPDGPLNITTSAASATYVQNGGGAPSLAEGTHVARPAFGTAGRLFLETDTKLLFRDTAAAWSQIGAAAGANSDITSLTGLTTPLSVAQGGTGQSALASVLGIGSALKWTTARTLSFTGGATGSGSLDGSADLAIALSLASIATGNLLANTSGSPAAPIATPFSSITGAGSAAKWATARTLSFTGDVTGSGSVDGSGDVATALTIGALKIATAMIQAGAVTLAKIANAAASSKLLGSGAAGAGSAYAELTLGTNLSMSGTTLNASTASSGLTDYSEGTWTPVLQFGGTSTGITYSIQDGFYKKIGKVVFCTMSITLSNKGSATGNAAVAGLPFAPKTGNSTAAPMGFNTASTSGASLALDGASTTARLFNVTSGVQMTNATFVNASSIWGNFFYFTDS